MVTADPIQQALEPYLKIYTEDEPVHETAPVGVALEGHAWPNFSNQPWFDGPSQKGNGPINLILSTSRLQFFNTYVGSRSTQFFRIFNPGTQNVYINSMSVPLGFYVYPSQGTIGAGGNFRVGVTFHPDNCQYYSGSVGIFPNSSQAHSLFVYVSGQGI